VIDAKKLPLLSFRSGVFTYFQAFANPPVT